MQELLPSYKKNQLWAVDLETKGTDAADPANFVVGIGFADQDGCFYVDLLRASDSVRSYLRDYLCHTQLTAFNVAFDGAFLQRFTGKWLDWKWCSYGLFKMLSSEAYDGQSWNLEVAQRTLLGWPQSNKTTLDQHLKERKLAKGDMWLLPPEILGDYCAIDADAHWFLLQHLLADIKRGGFEQALEFHEREFMTSVKLIVEQQLAGILIDRQGIQEYIEDLDNRIAQTKADFENHEEVAPWLQTYAATVEAEYEASKPAEFTKTGKPSKNYQNWVDRKSKFIEANAFNPNSKKQLQWLFFECLKYRPTAKTDKGAPKVDKDSLGHFGEPGQLLKAYNKLVKERGYVARVLDKSERDSRVHLQFNSYGAVTSRLGGSGGLNAQQQPKTKDYLKNYVADPGYSLVQLDFDSIEPKVLAEFSEDKALWQIYGPNAPEQDIYLYVASKIPGLGDEIKKYYDPDSPTPEAIDEAKKNCKRDRSIAKTVTLASNYNAGPKKIFESLRNAGVEITFAQTQKVYDEYWKLFSGVAAFEHQLKSMWRSNRGWIPDAYGIPHPIADKYTKDVKSRFCQCSAHRMLQTYIYYIDKLRIERSIPMRPWIVDFHDETLWQVPNEYAEQAKQVLEDALDLTNSYIQMNIQITGDVQIIQSLADAKCED